jgi:tRNA nucleotidyltransferase/poly(A) polymerase
VCAYLGQREEFYLQEFKRLLPERFMQEKYERTDGLCRIHLEKVFPLLGKNGPEHFLIHAQEKQLKNLRQELQDFISKGGRSSKEIRKEKNSWWIAIKKRVGKKGLKESIFS